jgi:arylsulfatase A-like enzyme
MQTLNGMISAFDEAVGKVFQALVDTGLDKETVFLLHSDNGAPPNADVIHNNHTAVRNFPLRGVKTEIWEGGTRVPAMVWAPPGVLGDRAGTVWDGLVHVTDVAPTLVEGIAGGKMTGPLAPDGYNQWDAMRGAQEESARDEMLYNINPLCDSGQAGPPKAAVQQGGIKLLCECWNQTSMSCTGEKWLFNLTEDIGELNNIAASMPAEVAKLEARLVHYASDMTEPMQWTAPYMGDEYFCKDCPVGHQSEPYYAWRPFLEDPNPWPPLPKMPAGKQT